MAAFGSVTEAGERQKLGRFADWQVRLTPEQRLLGRLLMGSFQPTYIEELPLPGCQTVSGSRHTLFKYSVSECRLTPDAKAAGGNPPIRPYDRVLCLCESRH